MGMDAKQFGFMVIGLTLGAVVLFVVGFEAGRVVNVDGYSAFIASLATSPAEDKGSKELQAPKARYAFFEELDAPADERPLRRLPTPDRNANEMNASWLHGHKKVRGRSRRRLAKMRRLSRDPYSVDPPRERNKPRERVVASVRSSPRRDRAADRAEPMERLARKPQRAEAPAARTLTRSLSRSAPKADAPPARKAVRARLVEFGSLKEASRYKKKMRAEGKGAHISMAEVPGKGNVYRVHVQP